MSNTILVIGESGTGKSTSIRNLDPKETFIINVLDKPLPFRGHKASYKKLYQDGTTGNYYASDDFQKILRVIQLVSVKRPEIKNLIIDDWQYVMCNEYMRRATENGFSKFTEIGQHAWSIVRNLSECRDDLLCIVLSHSDLDSDGKYKCKTIGKLLSEKVTVEGMFTCVFHSAMVDGKYKFITQHDGIHIAKSPMGMFSDLCIDNDLKMVIEKIKEYENE